MKPLAWGADNGDNGNRIVEDNTECKDQSGKENSDGDDDNDTAIQGLPIKDCNYCSSSEIMNCTVKVSCTK